MGCNWLQGEETWVQLRCSVPCTNGLAPLDEVVHCSLVLGLLRCPAQPRKQSRAQWLG